MTKFLIDDVAENAQHIAPCPACVWTPGLADNARNQMGPGGNGVHKKGRYKGLFRSAMPLCRFCKGARVVFLNRICECGMPSVYFEAKAKLWHCGSEECVRSAIWRRERNNSGGGAAGPAGPQQSWEHWSHL